MIQKNIPLCLKYLGRYCLPSTYHTLVISAINNELASCYSYTQAGAIKAFGYLFEGSVELIIDNSQFERVSEILNDFLYSLEHTVAESLDLELSELVIHSLTTIVDCLLVKQNAEVCPKEFIKPHIQSCFNMIVKCLAVF